MLIYGRLPSAFILCIVRLVCAVYNFAASTWMLHVLLRSGWDIGLTIIRESIRPADISVVLFSLFENFLSMVEASFHC